MKDKCPKSKKIKADTKKPAEKSKTKKEVTVSVTKTTSDDDGAWAAEELFVDDKDLFEEVVDETECDDEPLMADDVDDDVLNESQEELVVVDIASYVVNELVVATTPFQIGLGHPREPSCYNTGYERISFISLDVKANVVSFISFWKPFQSFQSSQVSGILLGDPWNQSNLSFLLCFLIL